ncbi:MAG TPA: ABC transporter permease [Gemmatimonadaceae bacterium]|nr:ABC transporter permease [Gemmatimonadaceae bacterium]
MLAEPAHGYGIARWIEHTTDDVLRVEEGSLYPAGRALGFSPEEAARAAHARFGDVDAIAGALRHHDQAKHRRVASRERLLLLMRNIQLASRALRNTPAFTATVVVTLSLGIGASTVIASAANTLLRRPIPGADIDRVVSVGHYYPQSTLHAGLDPSEVFDLERRTDLVQALGAYRSVGLNLAGSGIPRYVAGTSTSGDFFRVFRVTPYLGRFYGLEDELHGPTNIAVLSYGLWREITGGDRTVIGRTLRLDDSSYTVIGVAPPGFEYPLGAELWTPRPLDIYLNRQAIPLLLHGGAIVATVALLRPGMTPEQLAARLEAVQRDWEAREPQVYKLRHSFYLEVRPFVVAWSGRLRPIVVALTGAAAFLMLIACANVGALLVLRVTGRSSESAVRMALGASRARILAGLVSETAMLAMASAAFGVLVAKLLLVGLAGAVASRVPELYAVRIEPLVLVVALCVTAAVTLACCVAPALRVMAVDPRDCMTSARHTAGASRSRLLRAAVIIQVSAAVVLTLACLVARQSLARLMRVNPGFDAASVVTAQLYLPVSRYGGENSLDGAMRRLALHHTLMDRLRQGPGIEDASTIDIAPFGFHDAADASVHRMRVAAQVAAPGQINGPAVQRAVVVDFWNVDGAYFRTMGIPLLSGTGFTGHEQDDQVRAYPHQLEVSVVIDSSLARRLFPGQNPVGKLLGPWNPGSRIVGVAGDVVQSDLIPNHESAGAIYWMTSATQDRQTLVLRTHESPKTVAALVRRVLHDLDPELAVYDVVPLEDLVVRSLGARQVAAWLLDAFAMLSVFLCGLGVLGVINYTLAARAKELGIRLALGATPRDLIVIVTAGAVRLGAVGAGVGTIAYWLALPWLRALAYGVDAAAIPVVVAVFVSLVAISLIASLPGAFRASRIEPTVSLRSE